MKYKRVLKIIPASLVSLLLFGCKVDVEPVASNLNEGFSTNIDAAAIDEVDSIDVSDYELHPVILERVVDGDTIIVSTQDNGNMKIRLIGIDTPESVHSDEEKNTEYGQIASDYTKNLLEGVSTLYLQYDEGLYDSYDRVLAYVWLSDAVDVTSEEDIKTYMVNAILANEGMARTMTIEPNVTYSFVFENLVNEAEDEGKGVYASASEEEIFK